MGRMKIGIAVAGVVMALLGAVAVVAMQGGGGPDAATRVASSAAGEVPTSSVVTVVPAMAAPTSTAPGRAATTTVKGSSASKTTPTSALPAKPTVQDIQKVIAGITAKVLAPADTTASTKPLTDEQIEAQVREQLKQLGIVF